MEKMKGQKCERKLNNNRFSLTLRRRNGRNLFRSNKKMIKISQTPFAA